MRSRVGALRLTAGRGPQGFEGETSEAPEDEYEVLDALTLALDVQLDNVDAYLRQHKEHGGAWGLNGQARWPYTRGAVSPSYCGRGVC